ncbi:hypothetical protein D6833_03545 [Candidatus Parcubacteria bacterium]|nr:MAG: hypothetical protein D6833_03545 [Candidatus Parcubacteria bacterium]
MNAVTMLVVHGKGRAPLDERLGLQPGEVTAGLAALIALAGVELAFERSVRWLERFLLFRVSENTIRKETQQFGQLQEQREEEQIERSEDVEELQQRRREVGERPKRVYGSLDGAHVRIEERSPAGETSSEETPGGEKWREIKVGCFYQVEAVPLSQQRARQRKKASYGEQPLRAKDIHYFCELTSAEEFSPLVWANGCQAQADLAEEVVFVCDGAPWIWKIVAHHYPNAVQIVDWYHAEERLEQVALQEEMTDAWLESTRQALWEGEVSFVIAACEQLNSQIARQAATYFRNNAERMAYDRFREQGYMIGSGTVESGCKQIVAARLKRSGAQWHVQGANLTAKARAAWLSGEWDALCSLRDHLPLAA